MKRIILTVVTVFCLSATQAQETTNEGFAKGDLVSSLGFNFSNEKYANDEAKAKFLSITPSLSYFVTDKIALDVQVSSSKTEYNFSGEITKESVLLYGIGSKYYFNPKNRFSTNLGVNANIVNGKGGYNIDGDFDENLKSSGAQLNLVYGLNYFISKHFALTANLSALKYQSDKVDGFEKKNTITTINLSMENVQFGLIYKL